MKLATYRNAGVERAGLIDRQLATVRPVDAASGDVLALIEGSSELGDWSNGGTEAVRLDEVELCVPFRPPRDIFCVGKNYRTHAGEFARSGFDATGTGAADEVPELPVVFTKSVGSVIGPGASIDPHSQLTNALDYEAELAVVIGKGGRDISADRANEHVWGYTILNDVTARDLQHAHRQWFRGKSLDTFCPMGPWVVSADEVDATDLTVRCWVNGELRQQANTGDLIFDIPTLIFIISAGITLRPGDVIATGTPAGVGIGFDPPRFLQPGDVVETEITGLGMLVNRVAAVSASTQATKRGTHVRQD